MIVLGNYIDKTYGVLGLGRTGIAAIHSLLLSDANVLAWDDGHAAIQNLQSIIDHPKNALHLLIMQRYLDGRLKLMFDPVSGIKQLSGLVVSPGIAIQYHKVHPIVELAQQHGIPLLSDIGLLQSACQQARYIGITGTNGKSTTTTLIGHIYKSLGKRTQIGGNIGIAALGLEPMAEDGTYVLELSSFQLEIGKALDLDVAVLLNITPDHLDRYPSMDEYIAAKVRIFEGNKQFTAVLSVDYSITSAIANKLAEQGHKTINISTKEHVNRGVSIIDGVLFDRIDGLLTQYKLADLPNLLGRHNAENLAAAYATCRAGGLNAEEIIRTLPSFIGLPHRMQNVGEAGGLVFINDSKATNVDSARCALEAFSDIIWIAGGISKDAGIGMLSDLFPRLQHVYLIGDAAQQFATVLSEHNIPHTISGTLGSSMEQILKANYKQGAVLLSPACASLDQWKSYEERGTAFCTMVQEKFMRSLS